MIWRKKPKSKCEDICFAFPLPSDYLPPLFRFYHGKLSRREAEDALRDHGNNSWLIRFSENENKEVISMKRYEVRETAGVSPAEQQKLLL